MSFPELESRGRQEWERRRLKGAISESEGASNAYADAAVAAHVGDPTGAHPATAISFTPAGGIAATDVQTAIEEARSDAVALGAADLSAHIADTTDAHLASSLGFTPAGTITSVTVQLAVLEAQADAEATAAAALAAHVAAGDPHPQYTTAAELAAYAQPLDSDLTAIAALTTTAHGRGLLDDADAAASRTSLALGTIATQNANAVAITGGAVDGTPIGATTPSTGAFTTITTTGTLSRFGVGGVAGSQILVEAPAGFVADFVLSNDNAIARWIFRKGQTAEVGGNTGSELQIVARTDAGALLDTPLTITRAAGGAMTLSRPVAMSSNKITGLAAATTNGDAVRYEQITGVFQPLDADLTSWSGVTRAAGFDTFAATPSSANLAALVTGETGTGALVFNNAPSFANNVTWTTAGGLARFARVIDGSVTGSVGSRVASDYSLYNGGGVTTEVVAGATVRLETAGVARLTAATAGVTVSVPIDAALGAVGTPSYTFTGDLNTGMWSPAADTLALSTAGSERLRVTSAGLVGIGITPTNPLDVSSAASTTARVFSSVSGNAILTLQTTASGAPRVDFISGGVGTQQIICGVGSVNNMTFNVNGTEGMRLDASRNLLVSTGTAVSITAATARLQMNGVGTGASANDSRMQLSRWSGAETAGPFFVFGKSRGAAVGTNTAVVAGDQLGGLGFYGADGTNIANNQAASILAVVEGTVALASVPAALTFNTTASGTTPTERVRIDSSGNQFATQPAPAVVNATATLTVANLRTRIITSTTAAAVTGTLPTGTLMDGMYAGNTDMGYDWSVINTGATNTFTVAAAAAGHTVVGNMVVALSTSGSFRSRRTAANTWITYRIG